MKQREEGQITVISIGFLIVLGLLMVVVVNASAAFLQRQELDNIADSAALSAADGLSDEAFYLTGEVSIDDSDARRLVAEYVAGRNIRIRGVTTDGQQVNVRLERTTSLPLVPPGWDAETTIVSEATAQLRLAQQQ